jgi:hypothetical protein
MANTENVANTANEKGTLGSVDLTVPSPIGTNLQYVQDQGGRKTPLSLSSTKVGIGTANPIAVLTVVGGGAPPLVVQGSENNYGMLGLRGDGAPDSWQIQATGGRELQFRIAYPQNSPWLAINPDGNVGIGTLRPAAKLDVNGIVKATGLSVSGAMTFNGQDTRIEALPIAPDGIETVDVVVDPKTGKLYRQG